MVRWTPGVGKVVFCCLAALLFVAPSAAQAYTPTSDSYGGADRTINTYGEVNKLLAEKTTTTTLDAALSDMSTAEQTYVIDNGMLPNPNVNPTPETQTPAPDEMVYDSSRDAPPPSWDTAHDDFTTTPAPAPVAPAGTVSMSVTVVDPCGRTACPSRTTNRRYKKFVCKGFSNSGAYIFNYWQNWWWDYRGGKVVRAGHVEGTNYTAIFWSYVGSRYLLPIGTMGTFYVGRETQGHFRLGIHGVSKDRYPQIQGMVRGDGSWGYSCIRSQSPNASRVVFGAWATSSVVSSSQRDS